MCKKPMQKGQLDSHYDGEIISMMEETTVCLCCGISLKYLDKEKRRNRGYCSLDCYYEKPPKFAYAEKVYKKPIKTLIMELLNNTNNVQATAELLGMQKQGLYKYLNKHNIVSITVWKEGINNDTKTEENRSLDVESIKERCAKTPHAFQHRRF